MDEVLEVIKDRYFSRGKSRSLDQLEKVKVRNAILRLCEENLSDPSDVLVFEIMRGFLPYAVAVLNDELLESQYIVSQITENLFEARMVEIEGVF